jgi:hypothetical protein
MIFVPFNTPRRPELIFERVGRQSISVDHSVDQTTFGFGQAN